MGNDLLRNLFYNEKMTKIPDKDQEKVSAALCVIEGPNWQHLHKFFFEQNDNASWLVHGHDKMNATVVMMVAIGKSQREFHIHQCVNNVGYTMKRTFVLDENGLIRSDFRSIVSPQYIMSTEEKSGHFSPRDLIYPKFIEKTIEEVSAKLLDVIDSGVEFPSITQQILLSKNR